MVQKMYGYPERFEQVIVLRFEERMPSRLLDHPPAVEQDEDELLEAAEELLKAMQEDEEDENEDEDRHRHHYESWLDAR